MTNPRFTILLLVMSAKMSYLSRQFRTQIFKSILSDSFQYVGRSKYTPWVYTRGQLCCQPRSWEEESVRRELPARTGLNGLTLHHNKPFANKRANWTNRPSRSCQYLTVLLINWILNKLHLLGLALIAASCMQYKLISQFLLLGLY